MVYLEAAIQGFSLIQSFYLFHRKKIKILFWYTCGIPVGRGSSPVELQTREILTCFSYFIIYCVNGCFWGTVLSGCFIILSTLFVLNLTCKESFLESTLSGWTFGKYLVLHQLLIKHQLCVGSLERFPSQMTNLLTQ